MEITSITINKDGDEKPSQVPLVFKENIKTKEEK
jgi:hypothetical protein